MKKTQRKPDRAAVAKSLRELQILYRNDNDKNPGEGAFIGTAGSLTKGKSK